MLYSSPEESRSACSVPFTRRPGVLRYLRLSSTSTPALGELGPCPIGAGSTATHGIQLPGPPWVVASGDGDLWVLTRNWPSAGGGSLLRVVPTTGVVSRTMRFQADPWALTFGFGSVWVVAQQEGQSGATVVQVNAGSGEVVATMHDPRFGLSIAATGRFVWVAGGDSAPDRIFQIDPTMDRVTGRVARVPGGTVISLAAQGDVLWSAGAGGVASFDGVSGRIIHHAAFGAPGVELSIRDGSVWVAQLGGNGALATGNLVRISAHTGAVAGKPLSLPVAPGFVAITSDALWTGALPARATPSLIRVDPNSGQTRAVPLEGLPVDVVSLDDVVWVALRQPDKLVAIC